MLATIPQMTFLVITILFTLGFSATVYIISNKYDKMWFYVYAMMMLIQSQWMSDAGLLLIYQNYYFFLSSVILFPSIVFCLFFIYVLHGNRSVKQLLYSLLVGEFGYFISIIFLKWLGNIPPHVTFDQTWFNNHIFSSLALVVDYFVLLIIWPFVHNTKLKIPLFVKVFLTFWTILVADSLVFTLGTFWNSPNLLEIISGNLVIRTFVSTLLTPLITLYLSSIAKKTGGQLVYRSWDLFKNDLEDQQQIIAETKAKLTDLENLQAQLQQKNTDLQNQRKAIINILEDVQAEKNLVTIQADKLRRFEAAAKQSNEMMVFTDPDGIVEWGNQATETITGFTVKEASGRKAGLLWGHLMSKEWYANLWHTIKIDKQIFVSEIENHRKNGQHFWSTFTVYPLLDEQQNLTAMVATQRDITHEKEVDRMKTDFISLASHQLRTPLSAMKWFLEMLLNGDMGNLSVAQHDAIDNIEQSNERMIALVNGLLNISRIESGRIIVEPEMTDIAKLINNIDSELSLKFKSQKQEVILSLDPNIPEIMIDTKLIRQVIINLLTNAIKYTKVGGKISITTTIESNYVIVQVSDNGFGIPEIEQPKIFTRFFRASNIIKQETDGTGLGLYLAKAIIESSGGKIWFKSIEGQGSSFYFSLPLTGMKQQSGEVRLS